MSINQDRISLSRSLPKKITPLTLTGKSVVLKPLKKSTDIELLYNISNGSEIRRLDKVFPAYDPDELIWKYLRYGSMKTLEEFKGFVEWVINRNDTLMFVIYENGSLFPVGSVSYLNNFPEHLRIEIGVLWISPIAQRSGSTTEAVFLMTDYAFQLGYRRVDFTCNAVNKRANQFAERFGFVPDILQESWAITALGCNFDLLWYRILDVEWQEIKERLVKKFGFRDC